MLILDLRPAAGKSVCLPPKACDSPSSSPVAVLLAFVLVSKHISTYVVFAFQGFHSEKIVFIIGEKYFAENWLNQIISFFM